MRRLAQVLTWLMVPLSSLAAAQQPLPPTTFDSIPEGTQLVSNPIGLQGDVNVAGELDVNGEMQTGSGVRFPDGTLQVTAAVSAPGLTANSGLYDNTIADFSPPLAYTEVCFKGGGVAFDVHTLGGATAGGNCVPGDIGWIIERFERGSIEEPFTWTAAKAACLMHGMRLLEPFEWQFSCDNAGTFQLDGMTNGLEWVSNTATLDPSFVGAPLFGKTTCTSAERGVIADALDHQSSHVMRCGR